MFFIQKGMTVAGALGVALAGMYLVQEMTEVCGEQGRRGPLITTARDSTVSPMYVPDFRRNRVCAASGR